MQLPSGAQTWLACGYDNAWTLNEYLIAVLVDAVNVGNWQRGGDAKAPPPKPIRRPADVRTDKSSGTAEADRRRRMALAARERLIRAKQNTEPEEA